MTIHQPGDVIQPSLSASTLTAAPTTALTSAAIAPSRRYQVLAQLGQGGTCETYRAQDLQGQTDVAIKVLSLQAASDWKTVELFEREAQVLKHLDHVNIPNYLDSFQIDLEQDRRFYLVQELAEGRTLGELVERGWRANEAQARWIAVQVLQTLRYLHGLMPPVIHRDIKPDNLILKPGG